MTHTFHRHLATQSVSYHAEHRTIHAYDWRGQAVRFETPGELFNALAHHLVYARQAVIAAGIWLCLDHGVDAHTLPLTEVPLFVGELHAQLPQHSQRLPLLNQVLQRLDRGHERCARLAGALLTDDDYLTIIDNDGLFAATMQRMLMRESGHPPVHLHLSATHDIHPDTTLALVCGGVNDDGAVVDAHIATLLHHLNARQLPRYVVAAHGPRNLPATPDDTPVSAVVTARGIYRPDRVHRFYRDSDMGSDIISLS
ncbi:MAG: hypothetical protein FJ040_10450 [Chloroflexi bacterium]|nr:hypothetical protein [Chloroflexota bacterium]